jgi:hypothetical protein
MASHILAEKQKKKSSSLGARLVFIHRAFMQEDLQAHKHVFWCSFWATLPGDSEKDNLLGLSSDKLGNVLTGLSGGLEVANKVGDIITGGSAEVTGAELLHETLEGGHIGGGDILGVCTSKYVIRKTTCIHVHLNVPLSSFLPETT